MTFYDVVYFTRYTKQHCLTGQDFSVLMLLNPSREISYDPHQFKLSH